MSDFRTKRTLIKNSPVTTQTPSWILSRSTSNGRSILSIDHYFGDSSVLRSSIPTSRSSELRDERTFLLSSYGNSSAFRITNSNLATHRIIASGYLRLRSSTPRLRYTGSRSKDSIGSSSLPSSPSRINGLLGSFSAFSKTSLLTNEKGWPLPFLNKIN